LGGAGTLIAERKAPKMGVERLRAAVERVDRMALVEFPDARLCERDRRPSIKNTRLIEKPRKAWPGLRRHVAQAFARAPHTLSLSLKQHRGGAHSIEGRGALAIHDANEDRLTSEIASTGIDLVAGAGFIRGRTASELRKVV
jgi:hypothetical protein